MRSRYGSRFGQLGQAEVQDLDAAFLVDHHDARSGLHDARLSLSHVENTGFVGLAVAPGRIVVSMGERTGNVWMTRLEQ